MEVTTQINIRYADIDSMGHVNNAVYLSYFEIARMDYFIKNFGGEWDWKIDGIVLVKNEIEYIMPIFLNDIINIVTKVSKIGRKSITISYEIFKTDDDGMQLLCSRGSSVLVAYDYSTSKTKLIPDKWRKSIEMKHK